MSGALFTSRIHASNDLFYIRVFYHVEKQSEKEHVLFRQYKTNSQSNPQNVSSFYNKQVVHTTPNKFIMYFSHMI